VLIPAVQLLAGLANGVREPAKLANRLLLLAFDLWLDGLLRLADDAGRRLLGLAHDTRSRFLCFIDNALILGRTARPGRSGRPRR
jgi:hypothetical protein